MRTGLRIRRSRKGRLLFRLMVAILSLPLFYVLAAIVLGTVPANVRWYPPSEGITIFIRSNGVHTWVMMPAVTAEMDWRDYAPAQDLRDPRYAGNYLAFGYGNREFYLNTPSWADLTVRRAVEAAFGGGPTLLHVDHAWDPAPNERQRPIRLTPRQYRRLVAYVRSSFRLDRRGRTIPLPGTGYTQADMFYEANGAYDLFFTCNEWTGRALRTAGVRTGLWTPFEQSIMWRLD